MITTTERPANKPRRVTVAADCFICGSSKQITGNARAWQAWRSGEWSSAKAFRNLAPELTRWLTQNVCPDCFQQQDARNG